MNKIVIVNRGKKYQGKTSSIKEVVNQLRKNYPQLKEILNDSDITAIVKINGISIGIESNGDNTDSQSRMTASMDMFKGQCEIIVAACRPQGQTYKKIFELRDRNGYDIIWTSNDRSQNDKMNDKFNKRYAQRVVQLIEDIINGVI